MRKPLVLLFTVCLLLAPQRANAIITCNFYVPMPFAIPLCSLVDSLGILQTEYQAEVANETNKEKEISNEEVEETLAAIGGPGPLGEDDGPGQSPITLDKSMFAPIKMPQARTTNKEIMKDQIEKDVVAINNELALRNIHLANGLIEASYKNLDWLASSAEKAMPVSNPISKIVGGISGKSGDAYAKPATKLQEWADDPTSNKDMVDFLSQENTGDFNNLFNGSVDEQTAFLKENGVNDPQKIDGILGSVNGVAEGDREDMGGFFNKLGENAGMATEFAGLFGELSRLMDNLNIKGKRQVTVRTLTHYLIALQRLKNAQKINAAVTEAARVSFMNAREMTSSNKYNIGFDKKPDNGKNILGLQ